MQPWYLRRRVSRYRDRHGNTAVRSISRENPIIIVLLFMDQKGFREIHGSPFAAAELIEIFFRELVRALDLFSSSTPHFDS